MQFEIGTMLFQLTAFLILVAVISKFAVRPILGMMKKRQDHIEGQIQTAEDNRLESEKYLEEQRKLLEEARLEAKEIIERSKKQKEKEAEEILLKAKQQADRLIDEATKNIQLEKDKALGELRDQVGVLSIDLASKLLEKEVRNDEQAKLVDRYLEQVGRVQ